MNQRRATEVFYHYVRKMPGKKELKDLNFFRQIVEMQKETAYSEFKDYMNNNQSLMIQASEFPDDIQANALASAMLYIGLSDGEVFDLKDKDTRRFLNEMKQTNRWSLGNQLYQCASNQYN